MKRDGTSYYGVSWRGCAVLALLMGLQFATVSAQSTPTDMATSEHEKLVREFVAAFNAHDSQRMLALSDENIEWISLAGTAATVETKGAPALQRSMEQYFKQCPSCRSKLEWVQSSPQRVATLERAEWMNKAKLKSQKSLAVYEFRAGRILRVYYFPVE